MSRSNRSFSELNRRQMMRLAAMGALGASASGWMEALAADTAGHPERRKSCILLWMAGGPSQTDTFDPKPGHANSGPFKPIESAVPGMLLGPHLPKLAKQAKDIAIIRSMSFQGRRSRPGHLSTCGRATCRRGRSATRRSGHWSPTSSTTTRPNSPGSSASGRSGRSMPPRSALGSSVPGALRSTSASETWQARWIPATLR